MVGACTAPTGKARATGTRTSPRTAGSPCANARSWDAAGAERRRHPAAVEQGFDNLRVEEIAEAAGVSPRTFNNYFSSKEEAICAARITQSERLAAALRARPEDEPLIDALIDVFRAEHIREPSRAVFRLMHSTPALSGEFLRSAMAAEAPLIEAIAHRTGTDPAKDLLPRVAAAAIFGAMRVSIQQWMCVADSPPYVTVLGDALNQLRALTATTHIPCQTMSAPRQPGRTP